MPRQDILLGLGLRTSPVPLECDVERRGQLDDEVRPRDVPVEPRLAFRQPPPDGPLGIRTGDRELGAVHRGGVARRVAVAQDDGAVGRACLRSGEQRPPVVREKHRAETEEQREAGGARARLRGQPRAHDRRALIWEERPKRGEQQLRNDVRGVLGGFPHGYETWCVVRAQPPVHRTDHRRLPGWPPRPRRR